MGVVIVLFSEVTLLILRKMAKQFCCQLEEDHLKQLNLVGYHKSFSFMKNYEMEYTGLCIESNNLSKRHRLCHVELTNIVYLSLYHKLRKMYSPYRGTMKQCLHSKNVLLDSFTRPFTEDN